jgi:hypothetical protein
MPKPLSAYVPCLYCRRGPRGADPDPCSGVRHIRSLQAGGCFLGEVTPGKEKLHARFVKTLEVPSNDL